MDTLPLIVDQYPYAGLVIQKDISRIEHLAVVAVLAPITVLLLIRYFRDQSKALQRARSGTFATG